MPGSAPDPNWIKAVQEYYNHEAIERSKETKKTMSGGKLLVIVGSILGICAIGLIILMVLGRAA